MPSEQEDDRARAERIATSSIDIGQLNTHTKGHLHAPFFEESMFPIHFLVWWNKVTEDLLGCGDWNTVNLVSILAMMRRGWFVKVLKGLYSYFSITFIIWWLSRFGTAKSKWSYVTVSKTLLILVRTSWSCSEPMITIAVTHHQVQFDEHNHSYFKESHFLSFLAYEHDCVVDRSMIIITVAHHQVRLMSTITVM
jgi:hypothetical protein